ncbi:hypothetical protein P3S68_014209 [Capsicum galapagoense]
MSEQPEERKVVIMKIPEQMILSEVGHIVENKKLEETLDSLFEKMGECIQEAAIDYYFKPINMEAE